MDVAAKQAELDAVTWYHEFDFGNGLRTKTHCHQFDQHRRIWQFMESHLATVDFRGKSVLDIGSWDGYWSFYAEEHGARSVLASDDLGQNWSQGRGIHLAKELLGSAITIDQQQSVYDLARRGQKFDVILFLGVYYHLHDPFHALAQIRHCCHANTVVVIDGPVATNLRAGEVVHDYANHSCEWLPSVEALQQMLNATYFNSKVAGYLDAPAPAIAPQPPAAKLGWRWRLGMCRDALRGSRPDMVARVTAVAPPPPPPPNTHNRRAMFVCKPHEGVVDLHHYRPPFGLDVYDPRFRPAQTARSARRVRSDLPHGTPTAYSG